MAERPGHQPAAAVFLEYHRQQKTTWVEYTGPSSNADCQDLITIRDLNLTRGEKETMAAVNSPLLTALVHIDSAEEENRRRRFADRLANPKTIVTSFFAAEFFPDLEPPRLAVAEDPLDLHSDLREKFPEFSALPRISGEVLTLKDIGLDGPRFFLLDAVLLETTRQLKTRTQLKEVARQLIAMNYVPLDSKCNIIDPEKIV